MKKISLLNWIYVANYAQIFLIVVMVGMLAAYAEYLAIAFTLEMSLPIFLIVAMKRYERKGERLMCCGLPIRIVVLVIIITSWFAVLFHIALVVFNAAFLSGDVQKELARLGLLDAKEIDGSCGALCISAAFFGVLLTFATIVSAVLSQKWRRSVASDNPKCTMRDSPRFS